jgi:alpha-amylase
MGDEEHPDGCAVVLCNGTEEGKKRMEVGSVRFPVLSYCSSSASALTDCYSRWIQHRAGEKWTDLLGWHQGEITIGEDGWAGAPAFR